MADSVSGASSRRNFLTGAAVASAATIVAPTVKAQPTNNKKNRGVYADPKGSSTWDDKVADFSYTNDALAQLIVDMWLDHHKDLLMAPAKTDYQKRSDNAKAVLAARGIFLDKPIVILEEEYVNGFKLADALGAGSEKTGVVFVLPEKTRATIPSPLPTDPPPLLETARMLMAVVPNGI